jgi:hypothetical protein
MMIWACDQSKAPEDAARWRVGGERLRELPGQDLTAPILESRRHWLELGAQHAQFSAAVLYQATVALDAIPAFERRDEDWTVVIAPAGLTNIEK